MPKIDKNNYKIQIMSGIECHIAWQKRKYLTISVSNGEVFVKAPLRMHAKKIECFIEDKKNWIIQKIDLYFEKYHRFLAVSEFREFTINGDLLPYKFVGSKKIVLNSGVLYLPSVFQDDNLELARQIKKFFIKYAKKYLLDRLNYFSRATNASYSDFAISNAKTKWGSCDIKKQIRLNWRLVLLPEKLQNYVILHELCHTYYLNHSKNFWRMLERICVGAKNLRKELKDYSILIRYCDDILATI